MEVMLEASDVSGFRRSNDACSLFAIASEMRPDGVEGSGVVAICFDSVSLKKYDLDRDTNLEYAYPSSGRNSS